MTDAEYREALMEVREMYPGWSWEQCQAEVVAMAKENEEADRAGTVRMEASMGEFEAFFGSAVWRDLHGYFQAKLLGSIDLLTTEEDNAKLYRQQGSVSELSEFVNLPNLVMRDLPQQEQNDGDSE